MSSAAGYAVCRNPNCGLGRLCHHQTRHTQSYCVIRCACRGRAARWREVNPGALGTGSSRHYLCEWAAAVNWVRSINTRLGEIGSASFVAQQFLKVCGAHCGSFWADRLLNNLPFSKSPRLVRSSPAPAQMRYPTSPALRPLALRWR